MYIVVTVAYSPEKLATIDRQTQLKIVVTLGYSPEKLATVSKQIQLQIYDWGLQFRETGYGQLVDPTVNCSECGLQSQENDH